jgi:hypothetical protein
LSAEAVVGFSAKAVVRLSAEAVIMLYAYGCCQVIRLRLFSAEAVVWLSAEAVIMLSAYGFCPLKLLSGCLLKLLSSSLPPEGMVVWLPVQVDFLLQPRCFDNQTTRQLDNPTTRQPNN